MYGTYRNSSLTGTLLVEVSHLCSSFRTDQILKTIRVAGGTETEFELMLLTVPVLSNCSRAVARRYRHLHAKPPRPPLAPPLPPNLHTEAAIVSVIASFSPQLICYVRFNCLMYLVPSILGSAALSTYLDALKTRSFSN
ncbi:hypothetical protein J6590_027556 [Homalodisca vitripennis]|nr:hypothetical protein J6590_027556 [Homalodisca vitripennis]